MTRHETVCEDATKTSCARQMTARYALRQISLKAPGATPGAATRSATRHGAQCPTLWCPIRPHISPGDKRLPDDDGKYSGFGDTPDRRFIAQLHPVSRNNSAPETKRNCTSHPLSIYPSSAKQRKYVPRNGFRLPFPRRPLPFKIGTIVASREARCTRAKARVLFSRDNCIFYFRRAKQSFCRKPLFLRRDKWKIVTLPVVTPTHNDREAIHFDLIEPRGEGRGAGRGWKGDAVKERLRNRRGVLPFPIHRNIFLHSPPTRSFLHRGEFFPESRRADYRSCPTFDLPAQLFTFPGLRRYDGRNIVVFAAIRIILATCKSERKTLLRRSPPF